MADFLESAKNLMNSAVSRTSWEAQKQMRIRSKQNEIDQLVTQRQDLVDQMSQVAMSLYQQGTLADPELSRLCASVFELDHDLRTREKQLQEVKAEVYPAQQFAPSNTANYTPPPVNNASSGRSAPASGTTKCPNCGSPLRAGAAYCRSCGSKVQ